jgi:1-acyl-sn-glycerol-3-phosphate acyltransferase
MLYHNILSNGFRILAKLIPQIKHQIHNPHGETFDKPAIIISNHQSHLDLLYTLMLSPRIITLTNKWVWNCPFYGWIIRYADFLPIADGLEQHADRLQQFVDNGYSILVFPEGTRSPDCKIGRFHKGAFYLAQKFGLDILPVIIHGVGHVFPKQEFMMRKGRVDVVVCERQNPASCHFDKMQNSPNRQRITGYMPDGSQEARNEGSLSLLEIAKKFRKFYEKRYSEITKKVETPDYFVDLIMKNYIYKGAGIEHAVRKSLKKHNYFVSEIEKLPENGEITIQNIGYGEFALMAALVRKDLKIIAIERDEEKFEIARNCTSVPENLMFVKQY